MEKTVKVNRAFTLLELLIVVAIIGILTALLLPALAKAKQMVLRMRCASNQRQIFLAARMYADEHHGWLPPRGLGSADRWPALFRRNVINNVKVYYCPRALDDPEVTLDPFANNHNNTSYIINGFNDLIPYNTPSAVSLDRLYDQPGTVLFGEGKKGDGNFYMDLDEGNENWALDQQRHAGGSSYTFVDGHAEWIASPRTVTEKMWWVDKSYVPAAP